MKNVPLTAKRLNELRGYLDDTHPWKVGDIVSRDGTDEHEITSYDYGFMMINVRCIKAPASGWCKVGETEPNLMRRYKLIRRK